MTAPATMLAIRLDAPCEIEELAVTEAPIPSGVRLTVHAGEASDPPEKALARVLDDVAADRLRAPLAAVFHGLGSVGEAHRAVESGMRPGKNVVVL